VRQALHATAASALDTYGEGIRVLLRDPRAWSGSTGGRAAIAAQLENLAEAEGSGKLRGDLAASRVPAGDILLGRIKEEEGERPAAGDVAFVASWFGLPAPSILLPLQEWVSPEWRRLLQDPASLIAKEGERDGPIPPVCLKASMDEWLAYLQRLNGAWMIEGRAEEACVHGPNGEALWAGGFPVPKTLDEFSWARTAACLRSYISS